jgi:hypothetical protein
LCGYTIKKIGFRKKKEVLNSLIDELLNKIGLKNDWLHELLNKNLFKKYHFSKMAWKICVESQTKDDNLFIDVKQI